MAKRKRNKAATAAASSDSPAPTEKKAKKVSKKRAPTPAKEKDGDDDDEGDDDKDDIEMDLDELVAAGGALSQLGAHDAAAEILAQALALSPGNVDIMSSLASAYEASAQKDEALVLVRQITQVAPTHASSWFQLSALLVESNDVDGAVDALKRVIELEDTPAAYAALASCYGEQGNIDAAVSLFEDGVLKHPTSGKFHFNLATMLAARGRKKDRKRAVEMYGKAAALDPETRAEVLQDLAELHKAMGETDKETLACITSEES
ncbi:hypothetical protein DYB30_009435 [Aphanomyces astaci]|uniref:Uncharacterized protein n=1 Tax=Aphanomyces astaci TaxID=112090 RepID=A0A397DVA1_APHAT|nr:hypothetical protein DYB30_009435 [Aphanomyces astaci]